MHIGFKKPKQVYNMNNAILSETTKEKVWGVFVDNELRFTLHIKTIAARAASCVYFKINFAFFGWLLIWENM